LNGIFMAQSGRSCATHRKIAGFAPQDIRTGTKRGQFPRKEWINMTDFAIKTALAAALCGSLAAGAAPARAEIFKSEYVVSIFGLSVARSNFTTTLNGARYSVSGGLRSAGLAEFFDDTHGSISASGQVSAKGLVPASYTVDYTTGAKKKRTALGFSGGGVSSVSNTPAIRKGPNWIEVTPAHLKGVADPVMGFVVKSGSLETVCSKTLHVFDGETRVDFVMSPVGRTNVETDGYTGPAMTCALRFVPLSGYRAGKKQIEYLKNSSSMQATFAPLGATGLYAPVIAKVGTQIGTVTIRAARFGKAG
jgi:Protein of unknown function (DUF3108)